jgi:hypothetical protein
MFMIRMIYFSSTAMLQVLFAHTLVFKNATYTVYGS